MSRNNADTSHLTQGKTSLLLLAGSVSDVFCRWIQFTATVGTLMNSILLHIRHSLQLNFICNVASFNDALGHSKSVRTLVSTVLASPLVNASR